MSTRRFLAEPPSVRFFTTSTHEHNRTWVCILRLPSLVELHYLHDLSPSMVKSQYGIELNVFGEEGDQ